MINIEALKLRQTVEDKRFKIWHLPEFDVASNHAEIVSEMPNYDDFLNKRVEVRKLKDKSGAGDMAPFYQEPLLDKQQEWHLFRKMNFYKHYAKTIAQKFTGRTSNKQVERVNNLLQKADSVKHQLVCSNTRLAAQVLKKRNDFFRAHSLLSDLLSDAYLNIVKAVECFDYRRGFKFSTYATWVLMNNFNRDNAGERKFNDQFVTGIDESVYDSKLDTKDEDYRDSEESRELLQNNVTRILSLLDREEDRRNRYVIEQWFGIKTGVKRTLKDISKDLKLTKERVRQLRERGMQRIKDRIVNEGIVFEGLNVEVLETMMSA